MVKNVILLLSVTRGGTHFASDLMLSSQSVGPLIELGVFWQLYHKTLTAPDEIVAATDPSILQSPGYNFQFDGDHQKLGRALTYQELFLAACANCGTPTDSLLSLQEANAAFALGLSGIPQTNGLIFNKFTYAMAQMDSPSWTVEDCKASLGYLYQFFAGQGTFRLSTIAIIRNPYDTYLGMDFLGIQEEDETLLRIRSYDAVLSHLKEIDSSARIVRYEDIVNDFPSFKQLLMDEYQISVSPDFAINQYSINKPHGVIETLRELIQGTIYEDYYDLEPVVQKMTLAQFKRYSLLQLRLLWFLIGNKETQGGGSAIKSLNPALKKLVNLFPPSRSRYEAFTLARRYQTNFSEGPKETE